VVGGDGAGVFPPPPEPAASAEDVAAIAARAGLEVELNGGNVDVIAGAGTAGM
jgi:hypothetical protein